MANYGIDLSVEEQAAMDAMLGKVQSCLTEKTTASFDAAVALMTQYADKHVELLNEKIALVEAGENPDLVEALKLLKVINSALDGDEADGLQKLQKLFADAEAAKNLSEANKQNTQLLQESLAAEKLFTQGLQERIKALEAMEHFSGDCTPCINKMTLVWEQACTGSKTEINDHFAAKAADIMARLADGGAAVTASTSGTDAGSTESTESTDTGSTTESDGTGSDAQSTDSTDTTSGNESGSGDASGDGAVL